MRVAVTGGAGYIGGHVLNELLDHGHIPVCIDLVLPPASILDRFESGSFSWNAKIGDMADLGTVYGLLSGCDAAIHLAGITWSGRFPPDVTFRTNVMGHFNLLEACAKLGIRQIVTASSTQAFFPTKTPYRAPPTQFPIDESVALEPDTEYGLSKALGEEMNRTYARVHGMSICALRLPAVPRPQKLHESGAMDDDRLATALWAYIDPRDAARAFRLGVERTGAGAETFFICADDTTSACPTARLIERYFPEAEIAPDIDEYQSVVSNNCARAKLGFIPEFTWRN
jgi:nucleoside-diphosphate-sugar epimerase